MKNKAISSLNPIDRPAYRGWLVEFEYQYYCQGYETAHTTALVYATSFENACEKIANHHLYETPNSFINRTIL